MNAVRAYANWLLRANGMTQRMLANACNVSPAMISRVLNGTAESARVKTAIADCLGLPSWDALVDCAHVAYERGRQ